MKSNIGLSIIIVVAILGAVWLASTVKQSSQDRRVGKTEISDVAPSTVNMAIPADRASYVPYSQEQLKQSLTKGNVLLFFAATSWCQTCIGLDKELIERYTEIPEDLTILKVDYDRDAELKKKYFVTVQHTLVLLDASGKEITRWVGGGIDLLLANSGY